MGRLLASALIACAAGCSGDVASSESNGQEPASRTSQRWFSYCELPLHVTILHPDGTYEEEGGRGRWFVRDNVLHIEVVEQPTVLFLSGLPELMALDEDGRLPFVGPEEVEADLGGRKNRFRRCA